MAVGVAVRVLVSVAVGVSVGIRVGTKAPTSVGDTGTFVTVGELGWQAASAITKIPHAAPMKCRKTHSPLFNAESHVIKAIVIGF